MQTLPTALAPVTPPASYSPYRHVTSLQSHVPLSKAVHYWHVSPAPAKLGVAVIAAPGTGKSRLLGRVFGAEALKAQQPLVVLDPTGGTIDNLVDVIVRLPVSWRQALWPRITYVDV